MFKTLGNVPRLRARSAHARGAFTSTSLKASSSFTKVDIPLKKGIDVSTGENTKTLNRVAHGSQLIARSSELTPEPLTEPERQVPRSPHTQAFLSDEQAASELLAGLVRQRNCLPVPGSLSPQPGHDK